MKTLGMALLIIGGLALIYGGIDYSRNRTIVKVGSMEIAATEHRNIPIPVVGGLVVLIGGLAFLVLGSRRGART